MRIIGGGAKGRHISFPGRSPGRPTSGKIKGSLFNILPPLTGKTFLDVFAGSGGIGLEALSRGAAWAVFIENDEILAGYIKKNLFFCGFSGRSEIITRDAAAAVAVLKKRKDRFDVVFADPPYEAGFVEKTMAWFGDGKLFTEEGCLIIQHFIKEELSLDKESRFSLSDQRKYGDTLLSFLKFQ